MIIVPIKEGDNIERALKKFKRKFEKTGVIRELRERQAYKKPSVKKREVVQKAKYILGRIVFWLLIAFIAIYMLFPFYWYSIS